MRRAGKFPPFEKLAAETAAVSAQTTTAEEQ